MPAPIHFGIPSELFFFLALSPNAILPVAGLCQLSVLALLPSHCSPVTLLPSHKSLSLITVPSWQVRGTEILQPVCRVTLGKENLCFTLLWTQNWADSRLWICFIYIKHALLFPFLWNQVIICEIEPSLSTLGKNMRIKPAFNHVIVFWNAKQIVLLKCNSIISWGFWV